MCFDHVISVFWRRIGLVMSNTCGGLAGNLSHAGWSMEMQGSLMLFHAGRGKLTWALADGLWDVVCMWM